MINKRQPLPPDLAEYAKTLFPNLPYVEEQPIEELDSNINNLIENETIPDSPELYRSPSSTFPDINEQLGEQESIDLSGVNPMDTLENLDKSQNALSNFIETEQAKQDITSGKYNQNIEEEPELTEEERLQKTIEESERINKQLADASREENLDNYMDEKIQQEMIPSRTPSYEEQVMQATRQKQAQEDMYDLWESASTIGDDYKEKEQRSKFYEKLKKKSGRSVENLILERNLEDAKIKRDAENLILGQELKDKKAKSDPNSAISKMSRQSLIDLGMKSLEDYPEVSYSQLEKMYPTLMQSLYTQIAAKAKIAAQKIASQAKAQELLQKNEQFKQSQEFKNKELQQRKEIAEVQANLKKQGIDVNKQIKEEAAESNRQNKEFTKGITLNNTADKKLQTMYKDTDYSAYSRADESVDELEKLIARKKAGEAVKIPEGAAFFKYGKLAQGDESVLREGDIKNLAGGTDFTNYINKLEGRLKGEQFTTRDLEEMKKVVEAVKRVKKEKVYQRHVKPIRAWANKYEYDLSSNVGAELLDDVDAEYRLAEEAQARKKKLEEFKQKAKMKK